jgi:hypothetical protein
MDVAALSMMNHLSRIAIAALTVQVAQAPQHLCSLAILAPPIVYSLHNYYYHLLL